MPDQENVWTMPLTDLGAALACRLIGSHRDIRGSNRALRELILQLSDMMTDDDAAADADETRTLADHQEYRVMHRAKVMQ